MRHMESYEDLDEDLIMEDKYRRNRERELARFPDPRDPNHPEENEEKQDE